MRGRPGVSSLGAAIPLPGVAALFLGAWDSKAGRIAANAVRPRAPAGRACGTLHGSVALPRAIDARALRRAVFRTVEGKTGTAAVLPFFSADLDVRFLLVALADGQLVVTWDLPQRVRRRTLSYPFPVALDRPLSNMSVREIQPLLHFDPWWLLRGRQDVPEPVRQAAMATNLAGERVRTVYFDDGLATVVGARIAGRGVLRRDELLDLLRTERRG